MIWRSAFAALAAFALGAPIPSAKAQTWLRSSVEVQTEYAASTGDGRAQKLESLIDPRLDAKLSDGFGLTAIGRLRLDAYDELEPGNPRPEETSALQGRLLLGDHGELELREFYLQGSVGNVALTLGKQQVVWGATDGLKVLDVVNPQDFREFILDAFEDSRVPLWTANVEVPIGETTLQLLWLPDPTYHLLPERGAEFAFTTPLLVPRPSQGLPFRVRDPRQPRRLISDSDLGARLSGLLQGWDWTLNYLYHYRDEPVFVRTIEPGPGGPTETITPEYQRSHLAGGTFSNAFGDLTVRGELGYSFRRFALTDDPADLDGVQEVDELEYVVGLDWYGFDRSLVSAQIFQRWITSGYSDLTRDRIETSATLYLNRRFLNDTLELRGAALHSLNRNDGLLRARIRYDIDDHRRIWFGADYFYGTRSGLFGQYDESDRIVAGFELSI